MRSLADDMEAQGHSKKWLENAQRRGVPSDVVVEIARRHAITPESFAILKKTGEIRDPHGKSFFLLAPDTNGDDARKATLMTYILNAGTDYGKAGRRPADFRRDSLLRRRSRADHEPAEGKSLELLPGRPVRRSQRWAPRHDPERHPHGPRRQLDPAAVQPAGRHHLG